MAKPKKAFDAMSAYRNLQEILKKIRYIGNDFTIFPDDIITFKRQGVESIAIIGDDYSLGGHLAWMFSTCEKFFGDIKNQDIKIKGTSVEDHIDCVHIYKNMELVASYDKLGYDYDTNTQMGMSYYKYLGKFLKSILDPNSLERTTWTQISADDLEKLFDGDVVTLNQDERPVCYIGLELLPLLKDSKTEVCYTFCGPLAENSDQNIQTFVIRESYPEVTIYTLGAYIDI